MCGSDQGLALADEGCLDDPRLEALAADVDLDLLADWTADLTVDLGLDMLEKNPDERKIKDIEPIRYEKYDYDYPRISTSHALGWRREADR